MVSGVVNTSTTPGSLGHSELAEDYLVKPYDWLISVPCLLELLDNDFSLLIKMSYLERRPSLFYVDHFPLHSIFGVEITQSSLGNTFLWELNVKHLHPFAHGETSPGIERLSIQQVLNMVIL